MNQSKPRRERTESDEEEERMAIEIEEWKIFERQEKEREEKEKKKKERREAKKARSLADGGSSSARSGKNAGSDSESDSEPETDAGLVPALGKATVIDGSGIRTLSIDFNADAERNVDMIFALMGIEETPEPEQSQEPNDVPELAGQQPESEDIGNKKETNNDKQ